MPNNDFAMFTALTRFYCYDTLCLFCLGCTCCLRALLAGERWVGAVLCGLFCPLVWPLSREVLLKGSPSAVVSLPRLHLALVGGVILALFLARWRGVWLKLPWLRLLCPTLLISFGFLCCQIYLKPSSALLLATFLAILPDFVCELSLGEGASFIRESWYLLRAFLGGIVTCALFLSLPEQGVPRDLLALSLGVLVPVVLQFVWPKT